VPIRQALRYERLRRGWSLDDSASQLHALAAKLGEPEPGVDGNTVSRWERGVVSPGPRYVRLLALLYDRDPIDLGVQEYDRPRYDDAETAEAVELARLMDGSDIGAGTVEAIEAATLRLRRSYSRTPSIILAREIRDRLRVVERLLQGRLTMSQRRDITVAAGWLTLLLGTVYFDLGRREPAWAYRDVALRVAQDLGHAELEAWAWETPAWFTLLDRRYRDSVELSRAGQAVAPKSSVLVAVNLQEARALARLGERSETFSAIRRADEAIEDVPPPEYPDDHYTFDPSKVDFYGASCFLWLNELRQAEERARRVIAASNNQNAPNYWPTRVGSARMDLGLALARRDELDAAAYEAILAFDSPFVRRSTLLRGAELDSVLRDHVDVPEVRDFRERLLLAVSGKAIWGRIGRIAW
jgi:transcriptional regulator with XRE-family HTH domain